MPDFYARQVDIVDDRHGRFVMGYAPMYHELIQVGDRIVLTIRSGTAIRMNDCENVRIEDATFLAAPGAACLGRYMRGDNYYRYTIKPGPPPNGANEPRLISTCADGLNIAFATKGPTIEGCHFSFMGDDSVNLHGATFVVLERRTPSELVVAWPYSLEYLASAVPEGATARRLRVGNYQVLGTAKLTRFDPIRDCPSAGIFVAAATNVQICNNRLENCFFRPGESAGNDRGLVISGPIDTRDAQEVTIEGNEIIGPRKPPDND